MANETVLFFFLGMEHEHVKMLIIWNRDDLGDMIQKGGRSVEGFFGSNKKAAKSKGKVVELAVGDGYES